MFGPVVDVIPSGGSLKQFLQPGGQAVQQVLLEDDLVVEVVEEGIVSATSITVSQTHQHSRFNVRFWIGRILASIVQAKEFSILNAMSLQKEKELANRQPNMTVKKEEDYSVSNLRMLRVIHAEVFAESIDGDDGTDAVLRIDVQISVVAQSLKQHFAVPLDILFHQQKGEQQCLVPANACLVK